MVRRRPHLHLRRVGRPSHRPHLRFVGTRSGGIPPAPPSPPPRRDPHSSLPPPRRASPVPQPGNLQPRDPAARLPLNGTGSIAVLLGRALARVGSVWRQELHRTCHLGRIVRAEGRLRRSAAHNPLLQPPAPRWVRLRWSSILRHRLPSTVGSPLHAAAVRDMHHSSHSGDCGE
jgi:hypothetical protein